jgi:hypothetical protein
MLYIVKYIRNLFFIQRKKIIYIYNKINKLEGCYKKEKMENINKKKKLKVKSLYKNFYIFKKNKSTSKMGRKIFMNIYYTVY